jgi:hypothetical protein
MQAPRSLGRQGGISGDSLYDIRKGPTFWSLSSMLAVHHSQDSSPTPYVQIPLSSPALALSTEAHRRDDDFRHEPSLPQLGLGHRKARAERCLLRRADKYDRSECTSGDADDLAPATRKEL